MLVFNITYNQNNLHAVSLETTDSYELSKLQEIY